MMRIKEIKPSQRKQGRILVKLEDDTILRLTRREVLEFGLSVGMDLSEKDLDALSTAGRRSSARETAAGIVGRRAVSRRELEEKLERKGSTPEEARAAADWLEDLGAIDDANYAAVVARHYGQRGYGPARVREELRRRGVDRSLWDAALEELPPPEEAIGAYIQKRCRGAGLDEKERRRLADSLMRRGFAWRDVRAALERLGSGEFFDDQFT